MQTSCPVWVTAPAGAPQGKAAAQVQGGLGEHEILALPPGQRELPCCTLGKSPLSLWSCICPKALSPSAAETDAGAAQGALLSRTPSSALPAFCTRGYFFTEISCWTLAGLFPHLSSFKAPH